MKPALHREAGPRSLRPARAAVVFAGIAAWTLGACGGTTGGPESPSRTAVDLRGAAVMVLPVQRVVGAPDPERLARALDAEIAFWAGERATALAWSFPPELARAVNRTPQLGITLEALPVGSLRGDADYIRDPLLGQLRGLGALVDRRLALVPYLAQVGPPTATSEQVRIRIRLALVDTHGGRVLWRGAVDGTPGKPGDPALAGAAARSLAERLIP